MMIDADFSNMLVHLRALNDKAGVKPPTDSLRDVSNVDFSAIFKQSVEAVNSAQMNAVEMKRAFQTGEEGVEIPQVVVALEKASISFEAMNQVRNKLLNAYQEIMNMPV
ncbi:MAG: flagellar hook-basal body complex protein FliE [Pseudomonadota bacterium]